MKKSIITAILIFCLIFIFLPNINAADEKVSLQLESISLVTVLNMIATEYHLNIVISDDITGEVSVKLTDVDLYTALNAILHPNGYNYYFDNNVIVVKASDVSAAGEFNSRVVTLKYANPNMVKKALEAIKSEKGQVIVLDKTVEGVTIKDDVYQPNRILISDKPKIIETMTSIIEDLDIEERLISIEVKIVETTLDKEEKMGFNWPSQVSTLIGSGNNTTTSTGTTGTSGTTSQETGVGTYDFETGQWTWGKLTIQQMSVVLDLLQREDNSRLVSYPSISTLENHEALIKIQTVMPIPTINRFTESASTTDFVTFYDEEVGISLRVTPRINQDGNITMDVNPIVEDIIGYTGTVESQKPITTERSIKTRITVADGETAALGGLLKENEIIIEKKVPGLSLIPLLGKILFTSHSNEKRTTDLLILITPKIIK